MEVNGKFDDPRHCASQTLRNNQPVNSQEDYYRVSLTIPFLDHLIRQMEMRFSNHHLIHVKGFALLPEVMKEQNDVKLWKNNVKLFLESIKSDLPHPFGIDAELDLWQVYWSRKEEVEFPDKIYKVLKATEEDIFPNIFTALKLLATLPITTCEVERSISVIRRLKSYVRNTMTQTRLNGLALLNVHRDIEVTPCEVLDAFAIQHKRKLRLFNILEAD